MEDGTIEVTVDREAVQSGPGSVTITSTVEVDMYEDSELYSTEDGW